MGWFIFTRAIMVRAMFALHGVLAIWLLAVITNDNTNWYIVGSLSGLLLETVLTLKIKKGQEWKWFCPSVLFYLLSIVPTVWLLELHELERRIREELHHGNGSVTLAPTLDNGTSPETEGAGEEGEEEVPQIIKEMINQTSEQMVRMLEQVLLLFLILGRWILPKGELTHDQLSELLLVYIATAADIVEFFDAFKEDVVRFNRPLCVIILSIWSWSLIQFTMVLTALKTQSTGPPSPLHLQTNGPRSPSPTPPTAGPSLSNCCSSEVYGIVISILMQDAPFLVLRLLLIFKYNVLSYTNMFFTCKNTLVCLLLIYRLVVIQLERIQSAKPDIVDPSTDAIGLKLVLNAENPDQYYHYVTKVDLRDCADVTDGPEVDYVIRCHISDLDDVSRDHRKAGMQGVGGVQSLWWSYHNIDAEGLNADSPDGSLSHEPELRQSDSALYVRS